MAWSIAACALWGIAVAGLGAALTKLTPWYYKLRKPSWQPPDWLFGPAWTVILALASYAAWLGWEGADTPGEQLRVLVLFGVNGLLNIAWSPMFFTLQRPDWALVEVPFLWLSLVALVVGLAPLSTTAALLIVPYLLWVSFAAVLNLTIVRLNAPFGPGTPGS